MVSRQRRGFTNEDRLDAVVKRVLRRFGPLILPRSRQEGIVQQFGSWDRWAAFAAAVRTEYRKVYADVV
jgi:hypothetical protein